MFGIQVSLYFINSLLTITIFPNIVIIIIIITENYMLQSFFSRSFCFLSVFLVRCLVDRGFCWRRLTLSVLWHLLVQAFHLVPSRPMAYHPGLLPSSLQRASWFRHLASSCPNFLHPERSARWCCKLFPLTDFLLQIKDLPRWWIRWTDGLYRGPTQEKNYLLLAGIEPGSPSCESKSYL
jgi:hypothetical protein